MLAIEYHIYIWQVSAALTPVKYEWDSNNLNRYFYKSENFAHVN